MSMRSMIPGTVRVEITSADPGEMLRRLNQARIALYHVVSTSDLTVQITLHRKQLPNAKKLLRVGDEKIRIIRTMGLYLRWEKAVTRPVFISCCLILVLLAVFLPNRIFFVQVEGNQILPARLILEKAEQCGIYFGANRRTVRSEKVKNALLSALPELEWAGINTSGCIATICVKEKETTDTSPTDEKKVSSIVASRDGIILSCTVSKGNLLCRPGQAIKAGEILVSGYTDCGIKIQATQAEAEIIAQTYRTLQTVSLANSEKRGACTGQTTKYSLLIGKKLINFYKDSGICDATCAKIYEQDYLTLPGGFQLPVSLITETWTYYENEAVSCQADTFSWISYAAEEYLVNQMIAGEIVTADTSVQISDGLCLVEGRYLCNEMIGQVRNEETIHKYGEY